MVGSGTTLVEARLLGRNAIGYDIDPLAYLIARVKTRPLPENQITVATETIIKRVTADLTQLRHRRVPEAVRRRAVLPDFSNRDYWFTSEVAETLALLAAHIREIGIREPLRNFLWVGFSSLILSKYSVANALDIIHSRHHYIEHTKPPDVLERYKVRINIMRKQMLEFEKLCAVQSSTSVEVRLGDVRSLKLRPESIDLIFTSPPYATALDYSRAHFLAVAWMENVLGVDLIAYRQKAKTYIGSEQGRLGHKFTFDPRLSTYDLTSSVLTNLSRKSVRQANLTQRYFLDMQKVMGKMSHVLKDRKYAIVVVCPSHIRKTVIPTHEALIEIGRTAGLNIKHKFIRTIDARKRVLPYMRSFGPRMSTEYVLIFKKG
jgi:hypothetical protein